MHFVSFRAKNKQANKQTFDKNLKKKTTEKLKTKNNKKTH